ncbi:alpha/beta-hydrolase [Ascobolus immersus RN42]|uniref:Alpha/beta-hydrolase n=1 Tax=Ascobolus immersus RN42 TaxID=1160509 RepID=A0A3N4I392_ASCIM|nr:alpha/beta-hydrolase [Ascobolus immersus RN42]
MANTPIFGRAFWPLVALGASYFVVLGLLTVPWIQNHAIYMHKLQLTWRRDLTKPEEFGFARNQVTPFYIDTPDSESIFAWHILPLRLYASHRDTLVEEPSGIAKEFDSSLGLQLLRDDPEARLIISFHGNAGTVGAAWRPFYLRSLSAIDPDKIHILTIDYRGYGLSSGTPSEEGLITDGLSAVRWAMDVAKVSPDRIALVGQSLGTAVTFGVAERLVTGKGLGKHAGKKIELGAVVSIAGFSDMRGLLSTYAIGGVIPVLSPLKPYPKVQQWFSEFCLDTWRSDQRVASLVQNSSKLKLFLIHAKNDFEIPHEHAQKLFFAAANATLAEGEREGIVKDWWTVEGRAEKRELGAEGSMRRWNGGEAGNLVEEWIVTWGEHNRVVASAPVSLLVAKSLGLIGGKEDRIEG